MWIDLGECFCYQANHAGIEFLGATCSEVVNALVVYAQCSSKLPCCHVECFKQLLAYGSRVNAVGNLFFFCHLYDAIFLS